MVSLPPRHYLVPRSMVCAAVIHLDEAGAGAQADVLEDVLAWALRRDPDATRELLADMLMSESRATRLWASTGLLTALRAWELLS